MTSSGSLMVSPGGRRHVSLEGRNDASDGAPDLSQRWFARDHTPLARSGLFGQPGEGAALLNIENTSPAAESGCRMGRRAANRSIEQPLRAGLVFKFSQISLLANFSRWAIMRSLSRPADQRTAEFHPVNRSGLHGTYRTRWNSGVSWSNRRKFACRRL